MQFQEFDRQAKENVGRPYYFDIDLHLHAVEQMIAADEVTIALTMLDQLPGWFRDNYPVRAKQIKDRLLKQLYTTADYIMGGNHQIEMHNIIQMDKETINIQLMDFLSRAMVAKDLIQKLNQDNIIPHIVELAPGSHWLPIGLKKNDLKFTYTSLTLNEDDKKTIKDYLQDDYGQASLTCNIFVCYELIEHLWFTDEIYQHYIKQNLDFSHVLLSTPKYCIATANPTWYDSELGHLRTFTPSEFGKFAFKHWPEYKWQMWDHDVQVLCGEKLGNVR